MSGAARTSWNINSQRAIIKKLAEDHPKNKSQKLDDWITEITALFMKELIKDKLVLGSAALYCTTNTIEALIREKDREKDRKERDQEIDYDKIAENVITNYLLPSGRFLLDSKGEDCEAAGGWLKEIGMKVGRNNFVRDKITIQEILKTAKIHKVKGL